MASRMMRLRGRQRSTWRRSLKAAIMIATWSKSWMETVNVKLVALSVTVCDSLNGFLTVCVFVCMRPFFLQTLRLSTSSGRGFGTPSSSLKRTVLAFSTSFIYLFSYLSVFVYLPMCLFFLSLCHSCFLFLCFCFALFFFLFLPLSLHNTALLSVYCFAVASTQTYIVLLTRSLIAFSGCPIQTSA